MLGVDTEVVFDGELLGKPRERDRGRGDARGALAAARTRCLGPLPAHARRGRSCTPRSTLVTFRPLTPRDLARYLAAASGRAAPARYAIQGLGASLVERIEGDYLNVVGLPAALLVRLLATRFPGAYGFG